MSLLSRRKFFSALAASVVAAGLPLPKGFPQQVGVDLASGLDRTIIAEFEYDQREMLLKDLSDIIYNIDPWETPFLDSAP